MEKILELLSYFFVVAFTENVVFTRALGTSKAFKYARDKKKLFTYSGILFVSLIAASVVTYYVESIFSALHQTTKNIIFPAVSLVIITLLYVLGLLLFGSLKNKGKRETLLAMLPDVLYSYIIIGTIILAGRQNLFLANRIVLCFGSVAGYLIATLLMHNVFDYLESEKINPYFRGYPIKILFIGLMSLAFYGLAGHTLSF